MEFVKNGSGIANLEITLYKPVLFCQLIVNLMFELVSHVFSYSSLLSTITIGHSHACINVSLKKTLWFNSVNASKNTPCFHAANNLVTMNFSPSFSHSHFCRNLISLSKLNTCYASYVQINNFSKAAMQSGILKEDVSQYRWIYPTDYPQQNNMYVAFFLHCFKLCCPIMFFLLLFLTLFFVFCCCKI